MHNLFIVCPRPRFFLLHPQNQAQHTFSWHWWSLWHYAWHITSPRRDLDNHDYNTFPLLSMVVFPSHLGISLVSLNYYWVKISRGTSEATIFRNTWLTTTKVTKNIFFVSITLDPLLDVDTTIKQTSFPVSGKVFSSSFVTVKLHPMILPNHLASYLILSGQVFWDCTVFVKCVKREWYTNRMSAGLCCCNWLPLREFATMSLKYNIWN